MTLLFITLPAALIIAAGAVAAFMWAARSDQYEDLDTPPRRMLLEDPKSAPRSAQAPPAGHQTGMPAGHDSPGPPSAGPVAGSM